MEELLKLPEVWHVIITESNRQTIKDWFIREESERDYCFDIGCGYGMKANRLEGRGIGYLEELGKEITLEDFKRLVLKERDVSLYGVVGGEELVEYLKGKGSIWNGDDIKSIYYFENGYWRSTERQLSFKTPLPLQEYLKVLENSIPLDEEVKEVKTVRTWETVEFKTENTMFELTLNHEKKTFNLQTVREDSVSFKSDSIEVAKEKLKCLEEAINYAENALNN